MNIKIIDINITELKNCYKNNRIITLNNIDFYIGRVCGAIEEFRLFKKGKQYIVFENKKEKIGFIII